MPDFISTQDLINVKQDIEDIGLSVNTDGIITPRYGAAYDSLPKVIREMIEQKDLKLAELQLAIDTAVAAGVGAAGWYSYLVVHDNGETQKQINDYIGATWYARVGGYGINDKARLNTGEVVISTIPANTNNPNVNMTGWVLDNWCFESFGVEADGTDQSSKIQAAVDFFLANNIRRFGFRDSKKYCIGSPIRFKQVAVSDSANYADPKNTIICDFNGAYLDALTPNQIAIVVSRDVVQLNDPIITSSVSGVIGIYNGLDIENNDLSLRRSSMRMVLNNPKFENLDIAMKFEPAETKSGAQWGAFYHCVTNPHAVNTKIMYDFRQSKGAGDCSNTRNTFINSKHIGGACTIYGEALESSIFLGVESELINRTDSRLPDGEGVALYLPFGTPSDFQANKQNKFIGFNVEVCTNYVNINAPETHIDGFFQAATNPRSVAWKYTNVYGNLSYTEGGIVLRQYNGTPRFGMQQINDDGTSASLYLERGTGTGDYKISADGKIEIPSAILNNTYATNDVINFRSSNGTKNLQLNFNAELGMYFAGDSGYVGFAGDLRPALDNWSTIGTLERRLKNVISYKLNVTNLSVYDNNTTAKTGGLAVGDFYRTSTGQVMVVF